jgi:pimeloyl-ACP methyl ester carboxylesterase
VRAIGLRLHFMEWGRPEAPVIVMLHGLRSYAATWEPMAAVLADEYRVIALDQRGRGDSEWDANGGYDTAAYVSDLEQVCDSLGLTRFILLGHSMGGTNTFVYTAKHRQRVRAVIIEDIGPDSSKNSAGALRIVTELRGTPDAFSSWDEARAFWRGQRPFISESALQSRVHHSLREDAGGRIVWKHDHLGIAKARIGLAVQPPPDLWACVRALAVPTLLIRGENSDFLSRETAKLMERSAPQLTFVEVPQATHYVHDDNFAVFSQVVSQFLRTLPREIVG